MKKIIASLPIEAIVILGSIGFAFGIGLLILALFKFGGQLGLRRIYARFL